VEHLQVSSISVEDAAVSLAVITCDGYNRVSHFPFLYLSQAEQHISKEEDTEPTP
jgi:hypothetical protein